MLQHVWMDHAGAAGPPRRHYVNVAVHEVPAPVVDPSIVARASRRAGENDSIDAFASHCVRTMPARWIPSSAPSRIASRSVFPSDSPAFFGSRRWETKKREVAARRLRMACCPPASNAPMMRSTVFVYLRRTAGSTCVLRNRGAAAGDAMNLIIARAASACFEAVSNATLDGHGLFR